MRRCGSSTRSTPKARARWSATCAGCTRTSPATATSSPTCATRRPSTTRAQGRELNLVLIDYEHPENNVFEVTEEFYCHNGKHGTREDVVFLINGIPVLVIECKNATKDEAIALGVDQVRRYHAETPELFVPQMVFTATEAIGFSYGVTWNLIRRNIFNWKHEQKGNLEAKVKSFCDRGHVLALLKDYILFAEKDEELQKFILRQHQTTAVERVVDRCLTAPPKPEARRGLVWHTQGSGKTFTMIKAAELLFKAAGADKPTVLVLIDRNELEDQMLRNLAMLGIEQHPARRQHRGAEQAAEGRLPRHHRLDDPQVPGDAGGPQHAAEHLRADRRGPPHHRRRPGQLPDGRHPQRRVHRLHRHAGGQDRVRQGNVQDLRHGRPGRVHAQVLDPREHRGRHDAAAVLQPRPQRDARQPGADGEGVLVGRRDRGDHRHRGAEQDPRPRGEPQELPQGRRARGQDRPYVAEHYVKNVEPLGYKAFLVGVDRPACAKYKKALDKYLPPEYSEVVYTGNNNDTAELKAHHIDEKKEKQVRKDFAKAGKLPKILIVTEKLLTGYDAPVLYAMYLDKPMRDHTLLQAIARVNRPYEVDEGDGRETRKPHGFVLDFVGIFDKLEKALAFDSDEINAIVKDLGLLKVLFKNKMEQKAPQYLKLVTHGFNDKDVDDLIEHFRDKERRKEFFKEFKELEMLYEIISPDAFLRPYIDDYTVAGVDLRGGGQGVHEAGVRRSRRSSGRRTSWCRSTSRPAPSPPSPTSSPSTPRRST